MCVSRGHGLQNINAANIPKRAGKHVSPPGEIDPFLSTVQSHEITVTDMYETDHQLRFLSDTVRYIGIALEGVEDTQTTPPLPLEF
ncbi:hypothetical protein BOO21_09700 [Vibrio cidicii]|nr:hypothetical protein [Vibrio cidicii]